MKLKAEYQREVLFPMFIEIRFTIGKIWNNCFPWLIKGRCVNTPIPRTLFIQHKSGIIHVNKLRRLFSKFFDKPFNLF